jgi:hypothetical protein
MKLLPAIDALCWAMNGAFQHRCRALRLHFSVARTGGLVDRYMLCSQMTSGISGASAVGSRLKIVLLLAALRVTTRDRNEPAM